jgi:hypothetical protein
MGPRMIRSCKRLASARRQAGLVDELSEVVPGLFVGGYAAAESEDRLRAAGISQVLTVGDVVPVAVAAFPGLRVTMSDEGMSDLWALVSRTRPFLDAARAAGDRVLVLCNQGVNRSPALVAGYLVVSGQTSAHALKILSEARPIVNIHGRYLSQLKAARNPEP